MLVKTMQVVSAIIAVGILSSAVSAAEEEKPMYVLEDEFNQKSMITDAKFRT